MNTTSSSSSGSTSDMVSISGMLTNNEIANSEYLTAVARHVYLYGTYETPRRV
jgi:hypothetical protein